MSSNLYNGLIEDLGTEDKDNYVYLDSEGRPQSKIDLVIKWVKLPKKQILLSLNSNSPNRFLKSRITETMEQYSIFSGLKSFEILKISCMGQELDLVLNNQKKNIADSIQTGSEVTFDITSADLWLDMRVECSELSLILAFELKVESQLQCGRLKAQLLRIINLILQAKNITFTYQESDIKLIKAKLNEEVVIVKDSRSSALDSKKIPKKMHEISDQRLISNEFDYLDRYLICCLSQKVESTNQINLERRMTINPHTSNIVSNAFESFKEILPCRGVRIENFIPPKYMEVKVHNTEDFPIKENCCKCKIF